MRLLSTRRALGAALVPLVLVGVSACGGDDKNTEGTDKSSNGAQPFGGGDSTDTPSKDATSAAPSDLSDGEEITPADFVAIMKDSIANQGPSNLKMNMDAAGQTVTATGKLDPSDPNDPKVQMTMTMQGMNIEMVMVGKVMYMSMGDMTGGKFMKMDLNDMAGMAGMGDLTDQMDPTKQMAALEPGIKKVVFEGETSRGDGDAKEYAVTVDTSKVASLSSSPGVPAEVTYNLFFDDEGRMVGMDMDMAGSKVEMTLSGFSDSITIEAPPASQISDKSLSDMMGGAG